MDPHSTSYGDTPCVTPTTSRLPSHSAPSNCVGQTLSLELGLQMALPMPNQDEHLPDQIEAFVPQGGLEIELRLFQAFVEKADQELVLQRRQGKGGAGIRLRGTRSFIFKATVGEVTVRRLRIEYKMDGTMEVPSASAWNTSHQLHITPNLRDAVCDKMSDQYTEKSSGNLSQHAGDESLLGRSTILDIVPQEGEPLIVALRARAQGDTGRGVGGSVGLARYCRGRPRRQDRVGR